MIVGRVIGGIVGALVTVRYGLGLYAWRVSEKLEKPKYSVVETLPGGYEIRSSEAYVVAEATMRGVRWFFGTAAVRGTRRPGAAEARGRAGDARVCGPQRRRDADLRLPRPVCHAKLAPAQRGRVVRAKKAWVVKNTSS